MAIPRLTIFSSRPVRRLLASFSIPILEVGHRIANVFEVGREDGSTEEGRKGESDVRPNQIGVRDSSGAGETNCRRDGCGE